MPKENIIGSGKTKITAPVAGRSWSWQQDIWQVIKPVWLARLHSTGACSCAGDWAFAAPSVPECPCARHIVPLQQAIPLACHAAAHVGAHSSARANKHTPAPTLLSGAIETWSVRFMVELTNYILTCPFIQAQRHAKANAVHKKSPFSNELCGAHSVSVFVPPQPCFAHARPGLFTQIRSRFIGCNSYRLRNFF